MEKVDGRGPAKDWPLILFMVLLWASLFVFYGAFHCKTPMNSDHTTTLPMSADLLAGNVWLRGWTLGTCNFYFTEIVPYALGLAAGLSPCLLLNWGPGAAWAFVAVGTLALVGFGEWSLRKKVAFLLPFVCLFLIFSLKAQINLLNANQHNNLYALLILCLILLKRYLEKNEAVSLAVMTVLAGLALFSEGLAAMAFTAPLALFGVCLYFEKRERRHALVALSAVVSYLVSKALFLVFAANGGMRTMGVPVRLADIADVPGRIAGFYREFSVFSGGFLGAAGPALTIFAMVLSAAFALFGWRSASWQKRFFLCVALVNLSACAFVWVGVTIRYIVPSYFCMSVLLFLALSEIVDGIKRRGFAVSVLAALCVLSLSFAFFKVDRIASAPVFGEDYRNAVKFIRDRGWKAGYGAFWSSSIVSYYSGYEVDVVPFCISDGRHFSKYYCLFRDDFYRRSDMHFVLYTEPDDSLFFSEDGVFAVCGKPDETVRFGSLSLYFWKRDVSSFFMDE